MKRLTFNMEMSDARDLSSRVTDDTLVDPGVSGTHVEHHQRVVSVCRVVRNAIFVRRTQRSVVVRPFTRGRCRRVDLAPEVSHGAVVQMLVAHWFDQPWSSDSGSLHTMDTCTSVALAYQGREKSGSGGSVDPLKFEIGVKKLIRRLC